MANYQGYREPVIRCTCLCSPCTPCVQAAPAAGYFYTTVSQSLLGTNTPVAFTNTAAVNGLSLGVDGSTITVGRSGLYRMGYGITPSQGAGTEAAVMLSGICPSSGAFPGTYRKVMLDHVQTTGDLLLVLAAGQQLALTVHAAEGAPLVLEPDTVGAYLTMSQVV